VQDLGLVINVEEVVENFAKALLQPHIEGTDYKAFAQALLSSDNINASAPRSEPTYVLSLEEFPPLARKRA